jgi:hypothetical protein
MLKIALIGLWVIVVTAGAAFSAAYLLPKGGAEHAEEAAEDQGVEQLKAEMTSVPMMRGGEIVGYVIIQLSFAADRALLAAKKIEPEPYINDAAFLVIFSDTDIDYRRLRPGDLDRVTSKIGEEANRRLGFGLVRHVLIQQLNFVRREDIRTNWIGKNNSNH